MEKLKIMDKIILSAKWQERLGKKEISFEEGLPLINAYKKRMVISPEEERAAWNAQIEAKKAAKRDGRS